MENLKDFDPKNLDLAKRSCKSCYGTGVYGTLVNPKTKLRTRVVCKCVMKKMAPVKSPPQGEVAT